MEREHLNFVYVYVYIYIYINDMLCTGKDPTPGCISQIFFCRFTMQRKQDSLPPKKSPCLSFLHSLRCPSNLVIRQLKKARGFILFIH